MNQKLMNNKIHNLSACSLSELVEIFNAAFADYILKFEMTEELLQNKIQAENIKLDSSVGIWSDEKLVGFVLIGIDYLNNILTAYNSGTGVLPTYRGNGFTEKMYDYLIPNLFKKNILLHQLEVLIQNKLAFNVYKKIGFKQQNVLNCYKGIITNISAKNAYEVNIVMPPTEKICKQFFWNFTPAWQNSTAGIIRTIKQHTCLGVMLEGVLSGYLVFEKSNFRIKQFAVHKAMRNKGIATTLFYALKNIANGKEISMINVQDEDATTNTFLVSMGFEKYATQYQMNLKVR